MKYQETSMCGAKKRIYYLDVAKSLCAFLVVFAHLYTGYSTRLFIYSFHMPFFFLISGIFHKEECLSVKTIKKHFSKLIFPTIFFCVAYIFLFGIITGLHDGSLFIQFYKLTKETVFGILHSGPIPNIPCWFLFALFFCKVFMDVILSMLKFLGLSILLILLVIMINHVFPFYITQSLFALPFYTFGFYSGKALKLLDYKKQKYSTMIGVFLLLILLSAIISLYNGRISMAELQFGNHSHLIGVPLFFVNGFIGSLALIALSLLLSFKKITIINTISNSLITILGIQWFFIAPYIMIADCKYSFLISILYSIIIIGICSCLHSFFEKKAPQLIGKKVLLDLV